MGLAHKAPTLGGGKALAALGIVTAGLEFVAVLAVVEQRTTKHEQKHAVRRLRA
jgi:hypothetical protein